MNKRQTTPKKIVDANGRETTVHVAIEGRQSDAVRSIPRPSHSPVMASGDSASTRAIKKLSLKEMDGSLLALAIQAEFPQSERVREALESAAYLHRNATRQNRANLPRDTYITHPLRNALRLIRLGCKDEDVVIACILHDTVEDEPLEMIRLEIEDFEPEGYSVEGLQRLAAEVFIEPRFGSRVMDLVMAVTNPPMDEETKRTMPKAEKQERYRQNVIEEIQGEDGVFAVKLMDLIDNAASLHHTYSGNPAMAKSLAKKYEPLIPHLIERLERSTIFSEQNSRLIKAQLLETQERLRSMIAGTF